MSHEPAAASGQLTRQHVLNPITALAFYTSATNKRRYVLVGEDTDVKIYDVQSARLCVRLKVFRAQAVHGIAVPPSAAAEVTGAGRENYGTGADDKDGTPDLGRKQVLVWGGQSVSVLPGQLIEELLLVSARGDSSHVEVAVAVAVEARAPDWILDGRVSPFDSDRVVLLTAHNEVLEARVSIADEENGRQTLVSGAVRSPSRPILYSGNFFWEAPDCVLVAAGTVFGEILVWKCRLGSAGEGREEEPSCEVLFVFSGHEGSIFGVHISPVIESAAGEEIRLLVSCSDDRTIRVWDITERRDMPKDGDEGYGRRIEDARQTGFGDSVEVAAHGESRSRCVATVMGHASRIWQVEFPQKQKLFPTDGIVELYSFGEDATAQKWHLKLGERQSSARLANETSKSGKEQLAVLTHQSTYSNHSGKNLWSHAMTYSDEGNVLIATGGADGKVAVIGDGLADTFPDPDGQMALQGSQMIGLYLADVVESCSQHPKSSALTDSSDTPTVRNKNLREVFHRYTFVTEDRLLVVTNTGRAFVGTFGDELTWEALVIPNETRQAMLSYSVLESSQAAGMAFVGTTGGDVFCYSTSTGNQLRTLTKVHGKVTEIFRLSDVGDASSKSGHTQILITIFGSDKAEILSLDSSAALTRRTEVTLEASCHVTAASFCRGYLVLGSRKGSISILSQTAEGKYTTTLTFEVKRKESITSILPLPSRSADSPAYFHSTGRDGKYRIHEIQRRPDGALGVTLLHETTPPFGPNIEGAWFTPSTPSPAITTANDISTTTTTTPQDLILCGFRSKHFVVWNATRAQEIAAVECGGAHRSFAYTAISSKSSDGLRFAFTKAAQMHVFSQTRVAHRTVKTGGHGREIKAVSASVMTKTEKGKGRREGRGRDGRRLVATAAEDTIIRIWEDCGGEMGNARERDGNGAAGLRCVAALERHNAGIQALKWHGDRYLFSSGGNEEFFVWRTNALMDSELNGGGLAVVCDAVFTDRSKVGDLRIMDFDVHTLVDEHESSETTYRDGEGSRFCISMALSNSTVQSYVYTAQDGFTLLGRRTYTGACLTQLRHLGFNMDGRPVVLTAATDGHLAVFGDITAPPTEDTEVEIKDDDSTEEIMATKLHQSTIKALDMRQIATETGTSYLVVTGGDDDALGVLHLYLPRPPRLSAGTSQPPHGYEVKSRSIVRSAHAAAITGVAIARLDRGGRDAVVVSSSNDQRVKTWRVVDWQSSSLPSLSSSPSDSVSASASASARTSANHGVRVQLLDDRYSSVADAGGLEVLGKENGDQDEDDIDGGNGGGTRVLICGIGMEIWAIGG
ncbi:Uu.00g034600.m01.CDS01 [Anthostomella pinea]|uniref:Uu.00g034600.m01.CDS01 n=1 Tax=Anthostomella pinea TaxID=933095 RepID=A0AAI8V9P8_9PEZI|nr:Uu.00g034600.m01.CDS01 [Anthostomella pinea]